MITSETVEIDKISSHYDELDAFYREIWGNHVHHGYWKKGTESSQEATQALVDFMLEKLDIHRESKICDVGCGYGETSRYVAEKYLSQITSFTVAAKQFEFALNLQPENANPRFILKDWLDNNLPDECMDVVFSIESSEHMPDFNKFFSEASRVLKPGGKLAIFAWLESSNASEWSKQHLLGPLCREGRMRLATIQDYENHISQNDMIVRSVDIISSQVSRTWTLCIKRSIVKVLSDRRYQKFLLSKDAQNREFIKTLFRIRAAFAFNAMEYGLFIAQKI